MAFTAGWPLFAAVVVAVVVGALVGAVNGVLVSRGRITDFIVTLGSLSAASGLALILADGKPATIISPVLLRLSTGTVGVFGYSFLIAAVLAVVAHVVLFHTRFGTHVLATGGTPTRPTPPVSAPSGSRPRSTSSREVWPASPRSCWSPGWGLRSPPPTPRSC